MAGGIPQFGRLVTGAASRLQSPHLVKGRSQFVNAATRYTFLGFQLNGLLDDGKTLDFDQTRKHVDDGSLFPWLKDEFGHNIDLSVYTPEELAAILELFQDLSDAVNSRRKFGVEHNGLALLVAYCFEGIQQLHRT